MVSRISFVLITLALAACKDGATPPPNNGSSAGSPAVQVGNTAPVSKDQAFKMFVKSLLPIKFDVTDAENDALTFEIVTLPTHGTLVPLISGSKWNYTYQPEAGYDGPDSFVYLAKDAKASSNKSKVEIKVEKELIGALDLQFGENGIKHFTGDKLNILGYAKHRFAIFKDAKWEHIDPSGIVTSVTPAAFSGMEKDTRLYSNGTVRSTFYGGNPNFMQGNYAPQSGGGFTERDLLTGLVTRTKSLPYNNYYLPYPPPATSSYTIFQGTRLADEDLSSGSALFNGNDLTGGLNITSNNIFWGAPTFTRVVRSFDLSTNQSTGRVLLQAHSLIGNSNYWGNALTWGNGIVSRSNAKALFGASETGFLEFGILSVAPSQAVIIHYNSDGTLSQRFSTTGEKLLSVSSSECPQTNQVVSQPIILKESGVAKLYVVSNQYKYNPTTTMVKSCLARFNSDGTVDSTFDTDGILPLDFPEADALSAGISLYGDSDGLYVVSAPTGFRQILVRRYKNGVIDTGFGDNGLLTIATDQSSLYNNYGVKIYRDEDKALYLSYEDVGNYIYTGGGSWGIFDGTYRNIYVVKIQ